jgi:RHS repeat-associated protein
LGNTRVVINSSGTTIEKSHYYPFGMRYYPESTSNSAALPFRYNGKEFERMNGLNRYDYGKRFYDPALARFHTVDPLADKYYFQSPYAYAVNNPLRFIDFMGMGPGDPPGFWPSFGNRLSTYFENTMNGVVDRIYEPSLLVNDAANAANGIMTLASDVTGISNLVGAENKTANALGEAINTVSELPSMSSGERGAVAASALIMVGEIALTKKMPLGEFKAAEGVAQYTKSNLKLGQEMHKAYKVGEEGIKEFRLPSGKRIDFLDIKNSTIHELKPFNPRAMRQGEKQLNLYLQEMQSPATLQKYPEFRHLLRWIVENLKTYLMR